jgi:serine protease
VAKKRRRQRETAKRRRQTGLPADRQPKLEALSIVLAQTPGRDSKALVRTLMRRIRLDGWTVEPVVEDGTEVEMVPPPRGVSVARGWNLTHALRDQPEVAYAAPMFRYLVPENAPVRARKASSGRSQDDPATNKDYEWSLVKANVLEAWRLFGARLPGAGVHVGHPDTGYTLHPELAEPARLLVSEGYDYDDDDPDPLDDLTDDFLDNPGHGTGTGSVILSGVGSATGGTGPFVSGVAPHAVLIPIRTTESVVLFSMRGLRRAIDHATTHGAQVISMSLGGPFPGFGTERAIARAVDAGTIVLAAAGNEVGFVVFPAAFDLVIAVAASNVRDEPWSGSSHGRAVDITAPGESVWRARSARDQSGKMAFTVERGNGTSFAVATTAGVAALWVSFHGWTNLVRRFGAGNIARVFKQILQVTCRTPRGWDTVEYGPGIVDAKRLLAAPLPENAPARKFRDAMRAAVAVDTTGIETLVHLFPDVPRTRVEEFVADLLHVSDRDLPATLQEVGDELAFHLIMQPQLLEKLRAGARGRRSAGSARQTARRRLSESNVSSRLRKQLRQGK